MENLLVQMIDFFLSFPPAGWTLNALHATGFPRILIVKYTDVLVFIVSPFANRLLI